MSGYMVNTPGDWDTIPCIRRLYGLFARPGPRFDPIKVHVLPNAFEVLDVGRHESDTGFAASDREEHVVAERAPHALEVHAFGRPEAGEVAWDLGAVAGAEEPLRPLIAALM